MSCVDPNKPIVRAQTKLVAFLRKTRSASYATIGELKRRHKPIASVLQGMAAAISMENPVVKISLQDDTKCKKIGELASLYGLSPRTLRLYEDYGLLSPHRFKGQRLYTAKDELRLQLIITGRRLGFSLREVKEIVDFGMAVKPDLSKFSDALDLETVQRRLRKLEDERAQIDVALSELRSSIAV